ncbi:MAG: outer membrane beta-barrel protein [Bryobacteraceae bacterium]
MSHGCILKSLAAISGLTLLFVAQICADDGPTVQVFSSANPGVGPVFMPFEKFPVGVSLSLNAGYDTNVGTASVNEHPSFFSSASLGLNYSFGTERTRVGLSWGTSLTYYSNGVSNGFGNYDPDTSLHMSISHIVSDRLNLTAGIYAHYGVEPDFYIGTVNTHRSGYYFVSSDSISASYQWLERFSTVTSYSFSVTKYADEPYSSELDRLDQGISQQFRFLLLPMTTVVGTYGFSLGSYDVGQRNTYSQVVTLGVDQTIGPRTQGSLNVGAQYYSSDIEKSANIAPYVAGNFSFIVGEKTSLNWSAQYSTEQSNIPGASSQQGFSTGLHLSYAITPRITSSLSTYYSHSNYKGQKVFLIDFTRLIIIPEQPTFTEDSLDFGISLSYAITPRLSANADAHYSEVSSNTRDRPYSRARLSGGISFSF